jgi:hypothetical protein
MLKNKIKVNGGYIGLIMLLIGVVIIVFVVVRTDVFTSQKEDKNIIEKGNGYIDQTKEAKDLIEKNSQKTMGE